MGRYERRQRQQARELLLGCAEDYLMVMLDGSPANRALVAAQCSIAGWTLDSYFLYAMFLDQSLLQDVS